MFKVEVLTTQGDWVKKSFHKNLDHAEIVCEVCAESGTDARIISEGKIIR